MTEPSQQITVSKGKAAIGSLAAVLCAILGAYFGGSGEVIIPQPQPHPALVARLDALDHRIASVERRMEEGQQLAALVSGMRERLDLLLSLDTRRLDDGATPRSRR